MWKNVFYLGNEQKCAVPACRSLKIVFTEATWATNRFSVTGATQKLIFRKIPGS